MRVPWYCGTWYVVRGTVVRGTVVLWYCGTWYCGTETGEEVQRVYMPGVSWQWCVIGASRCRRALGSAEDAPRLLPIACLWLTGCPVGHTASF